MTDQVDGPSGNLSFEHDIRPLFRDTDQSSMRRMFDLWSYDDVRENQDAILDRLREGDMPCDGPWPADQVATFSSWIAGGSQP